MRKQSENMIHRRSRVRAGIHPAIIAASFVALFASCTPNVNQTSTPNFLYTRADTLAIPKPLDTLHAQMGLDCGCAFDFTVTGLGGDTSNIKFVVPKSITVNQYSIGAYAIAGTPTGTHSGWISFSVKNDDPSGPNYFYDTLHAMITVP